MEALDTKAFSLEGTKRTPQPPTEYVRLGACVCRAGLLGRDAAEVGDQQGAGQGVGALDGGESRCRVRWPVVLGVYDVCYGVFSRRNRKSFMIGPCARKIFSFRLCIVIFKNVSTSNWPPKHLKSIMNWGFSQPFLYLSVLL